MHGKENHFLCVYFPFCSSAAHCVVLDVMHVSNIGWGILPDKR